MSPTSCPKCHSLVEENDNFCRRCGRSLKPGTGFLYSHSGIILLALVLGPLALPLVWTSKIIGPAAKWIYTVILVLMGVYLVWAFYQAFVIINQATQLMMSGAL